jgi:hypothetical protein
MGIIMQRFLFIFLIAFVNASYGLTITVSNSVRIATSNSLQAVDQLRVGTQLDDPSTTPDSEIDLSNATGPGVTFKRDDTSVTNGDVIGNIFFVGVDDGSQASPRHGATIRVVADEDYSSTQIGSKIQFLVVADGGTALVSTMEVNSDSIDVNAPIGMGARKITSLDDPSAAQDAATKNYVDTEVAAGTGGGPSDTWSIVRTPVTATTTTNMVDLDTISTTFNELFLVHTNASVTAESGWSIVTVMGAYGDTVGQVTGSVVAFGYHIAGNPAYGTRNATAPFTTTKANCRFNFNASTNIVILEETASGTCTGLMLKR